MMNNNNINVKMRPQGNADRRSLMQQVYQYGFLVDEMKLYLDTHPDDEEALSFFNNARKAYAEAVKNYTMFCGPLVVSMYEPDNKWTWNRGPMPWEGEV